MHIRIIWVFFCVVLCLSYLVIIPCFNVLLAYCTNRRKQQVIHATPHCALFNFVCAHPGNIGYVMKTGKLFIL